MAVIKRTLVLMLLLTAASQLAHSDEAVPKTTIGSDRKTEARTTPVSPIIPPVLIPRPRVITACDPVGCWDNLGMRYSGVGAALIGPTGKLCIRIGEQIDCR